MTIYGAVAGGEGDTLQNLFRDPKEGERFAQVSRGLHRTRQDMI